MNIYVALLSSIAFGYWGFTLATKRDRSRLVATIVGAFGGLIGIGIWALVTRKPKRAPAIQTELAPIP